MPRFLIIHHFLRYLEGAYAIRPYRNIQYAISHYHFSDQKKGHTVSPDNLSIQIGGQSILHEYFSDQKNSRSIFHDQKLILGIDLFVRQGRGVLNRLHMYLDF